MSKYKVDWYEACTKGYSTIVEAASEAEAKELIDYDVDGVRTSIVNPDYEEVDDWDIINIKIQKGK